MCAGVIIEWATAAAVAAAVKAVRSMLGGQRDSRRSVGSVTGRPAVADHAGRDPRHTRMPRWQGAGIIPLAVFAGFI